jgi:Uncharacterized protein conserved in bacteria
VTTDGPFVETKEHLGGFWIIEADDLDAAREWGAKLAVACQRPIEVSTFEHDDATVQELFEHTSDRTRSSRLREATADGVDDVVRSRHRRDVAAALELEELGVEAVLRARG